jgi:hypothetical protein
MAWNIVKHPDNFTFRFLHILLAVTTIGLGIIEEGHPQSITTFTLLAVPKFARAIRPLRADHPSLRRFVCSAMKSWQHAYVRYKEKNILGPFEKFVDSPYSSEFCGGAVTVPSSKYLPWQAMHFLQSSTHFSKTCRRPFAASFRRIVEQAGLTFHVRFSVSKALLPLENCSSSHCIVSISFMDEL